MSNKYLDEVDYELSVKAGVYELPASFQKIAIKAIEDIYEEGYEWEGIDAAIKKKSVGQWVKQGSMGLLGNKEFRASVARQLDRNHASSRIDTSKFLDMPTEIEEYLNEIKKLGE